VAVTGAQRGLAAIRTPQWQIFAVVVVTTVGLQLLPESFTHPVSWLGVVLAVVLVTLWLATHYDDALRARREASGWVVSARASCFPFQVASFDPEPTTRRGRHRQRGIVEIRTDAVHLRVTRLFPWLSSFDVTIPWAEVAEVECLRAGWNGATDVCCFSLRDGRELTLYVTRAVIVERAIKRLGVPLSSQRFGRSATPAPAEEV
jgi:hypothetical protein